MQAEALRSSLHELEGLLKEHTPLMSGSIVKSVDRAMKYGAVFAEVGCPTSTWNEQKLTPDSSIQLQRLFSVLPRSLLRFVLAIGISKAVVTLDGLALEGTKQVRPNAVGPLRSGPTYFAFGEGGR